jgi:hypothetical protein
MDREHQAQIGIGREIGIEQRIDVMDNHRDDIQAHQDDMIPTNGMDPHDSIHQGGTSHQGDMTVRGNETTIDIATIEIEDETDMEIVTTTKETVIDIGILRVGVRPQGEIEMINDITNQTMTTEEETHREITIDEVRVHTRRP